MSLAGTDLKRIGDQQSAQTAKAVEVQVEEESADDSMSNCSSASSESQAWDAAAAAANTRNPVEDEEHHVSEHHVSEPTKNTATTSTKKQKQTSTASHAGLDRRQGSAGSTSRQTPIRSGAPAGSASMFSLSTIWIGNIPIISREDQAAWG